MLNVTILSTNTVSLVIPAGYVPTGLEQLWLDTFSSEMNPTVKLAVMLFACTSSSSTAASCCTTCSTGFRNSISGKFSLTRWSPLKPCKKYSVTRPSPSSPSSCP